MKWVHVLLKSNVTLCKACLSLCTYKTESEFRYFWKVTFSCTMYVSCYVFTPIKPEVSSGTRKGNIPLCIVCLSLWIYSHKTGIEFIYSGKVMFPCSIYVSFCVLSPLKPEVSSDTPGKQCFFVSCMSFAMYLLL